MRYPLIALAIVLAGALTVVAVAVLDTPPHPRPLGLTSVDESTAGLPEGADPALSRNDTRIEVTGDALSATKGGALTATQDDSRPANALAPIYGDIVVGETTIEALLRNPDDASAIELATARVRGICREIVDEIARTNPSIATLAMPNDVAETHSLNGGLILTMRSGLDDGPPAIFVPCPPEYAERVAELRHIALTLANTDVYMRRTLRQWKSSLPGEEAQRVVSAVPNLHGSGLLLMDAGGAVVREVYFNIPAQIH